MYICILYGCISVLVSLGRAEYLWMASPHVLLNCTGFNIFCEGGGFEFDLPMTHQWSTHEPFSDYLGAGYMNVFAPFSSIQSKILHKLWAIFCIIEVLKYFSIYFTPSEVAFYFVIISTLQLLKVSIWFVSCKPWSFVQLGISPLSFFHGTELLLNSSNIHSDILSRIKSIAISYAFPRLNRNYNCS